MGWHRSSNCQCLSEQTIELFLQMRKAVSWNTIQWLLTILNSHVPGCQVSSHKPVCWQLKNLKITVISNIYLTTMTDLAATTTTSHSPFIFPDQ